MITHIIFDMDNTLIDEFGSTVRPGITNFLKTLKKKIFICICGQILPNSAQRKFYFCIIYIIILKSSFIVKTMIL